MKTEKQKGQIPIYVLEFKRMKDSKQNQRCNERIKLTQYQFQSEVSWALKE